jgi:hypothetical protein
MLLVYIVIDQSRWGRQVLSRIQGNLIYVTIFKIIKMLRKNFRFVENFWKFYGKFVKMLENFVENFLQFLKILRKFYQLNFRKFCGKFIKIFKIFGKIFQFF